ncbi:hypothetical protein BGZ73_002995 [Actinomortierella ambigua]|nr:hypothetical protein BGZ73_002995 [Actinomortierella ambigua]
MNDLMNIPELADQLACHLDLASLACCVRVCKTWHALLIPRLWHTFGCEPPFTHRFGMNEAPLIRFKKASFPIHIQGPHPHSTYTTSRTTIPVFTLANPDLYPHPPSFHYLSPSRRSNLWSRFLHGHRLTADEQAAVQASIEKHSRHIRCLIVLTPNVFAALEHRCTLLRALFIWIGPGCGYSGDGKFVDLYGEEHSDDWLPRAIEQFVQRQPLLESFSCRNARLIPSKLARLIAQTTPAPASAYVNQHHNQQPLPNSRDQKKGGATTVCRHRRHWKHIDIGLKDGDYLDMVARLPYVQYAQFRIRMDNTLATPLAEPHRRLRELRLFTTVFDDQDLRGVLGSFPNLQRLVVHNAGGLDEPPVIDLLLDRPLGGTMLIYRGSLEDDAVVARMIAQLPDLMVIDFYNMKDECFAALAQHCPRLRHVRADWDGEPVFIGEDDYDFLPPPAISLLLTSCPELETIDCPDTPLHIRHVLDGGEWICRNLRYLRCEMLGIPWMDWSYELYESLMARWSELAPSCASDPKALSSSPSFLSLSEPEQEMLRTIALREQCRSGMEAQMSRVPLLRVDPKCECWNDYMHEKGYRNYLRLKYKTGGDCNASAAIESMHRVPSTSVVGSPDSAAALELPYEPEKLPLMGRTKDVSGEFSVA